MKRNSLLLFALVLPAAARAEEGAELGQALLVHGGASNIDAGGGLGYRLRWGSGWQLGLDVGASVPREIYIGGHATRGGAAVSGQALTMAPLVSAGRLDLGLLVGAGLRFLSVDETMAAQRRSMTLLTRFGPVGRIDLGEVSLRLGWLNIFNLQLDPGTDMDALGQILLIGASVPVGTKVQLYIDVETGGTIGYDGDGGKYLIRGLVGARWFIAGDQWGVF